MKYQVSNVHVPVSLLHFLDILNLLKTVNFFFSHEFWLFNTYIKMSTCSFSNEPFIYFQTPRQWSLQSQWIWNGIHSYQQVAWVVDAGPLHVELDTLPSKLYGISHSIFQITNRCIDRVFRIHYFAKQKKWQDKWSKYMQNIFWKLYIWFQYPWFNSCAKKHILHLSLK